MTMRQRADDGDGIPVLGNDGAAFEQCLEPGDPLRRLRFFGQWDKLRADRSKRI
jgi:hypothetical protein